MIDFRKAELRELDLESRSVVTESDSLQYDYLVLALGSVPNFFYGEGAAHHSFPLRTMDDAIPLRYHVLACFERAAQGASDPEERRAPYFASPLSVGAPPEWSMSGRWQS